MLVKDVMTREVVSVGPDEAVDEIARALLRHNVSAVPVVDGGRVVGIVSEGDLLRRLEGEPGPRHWWLSLLADRTTRFVRAHGTRARDVMTPRVIVATEDMPVERVAEILESRHIKRLPVIHDGRLAGIVSRADLLRGVAARSGGAAAPSESDRALRDRILGVIRDRTQASTGSVAVIVVGGAAYLWGVVESRRDKEAIRVAAEQVAGTGKVHDFLSTAPEVVRGAIS